MLNEAVHMGLIKALVFANALKEHDPDCEWVDESDRRNPIAKMLITVGRTALVIQVTSVLDEGLQHVLAAEYPGQGCDRLHNRIEYLRARGRLRFPDRADALCKLRNKLAHERDMYATWDDWDQAFRCAQVELTHLGVVHRPIITSESDPDEHEEEDDGWE